MANQRNNTFILKVSNVAGKVPLTSNLLLGEVAVNTADAKMYSLFTGGATAATSVQQIGWDRLSALSGGTVSGNVYANLFSATTISATTYYGNGANLTGITGGTFTTASTYNAALGVLAFTRNDGFTYSASTWNYVSAATLSQNVLSVISNGGSATNTTINAATGGTYNSGTGTITLAGTGVLSTITGITTGGSAVPYTTALTYSNNVIAETNNTGGTLTALINTMTGLTINGTLTATTITATTITAATSISLNGITYTGLQNTLKYYAEPSTVPTISPTVVGARSIALGDGAKAPAADMFVYGLNAGSGMTNGISSILIGSQAGYGATSLQYSNFFGQNAGMGGSSVQHSNFFGVSAGFNASSVQYSNFLGNQAGYQATNALQSNFFGANAGLNGTNASNSNFFGNNAGQSATNASGSTFIGLNAGNGATNSNNAIFVGVNAGNGVTAANNSIFMGQNVGTGATSANNSIFLGQNAGQNATSANNSFFAGQGAGSGATTASNSILFGQFAGAAFSGNNISSNNIIIGTNISLHSGATNSFNIGGVLFGKNTYATTTGTPNLAALTGGSVGINVVPSAITNTLHVSATTNPVRIEGLTASTTDTKLVSIDSTGVLHSFSTSLLTGNTANVTVTASTGTTIYNVPTSAYTGAFFDYTVLSTLGARAGTIMSIFSGTSVQYTDNSTNDIGATSAFTFGMSVVAGNAVLSSSATSGTWTVKTIVRAI